MQNDYQASESKCVPNMTNRIIISSRHLAQEKMDSWLPEIHGKTRKANKMLTIRLHFSGEGLAVKMGEVRVGRVIWAIPQRSVSLKNLCACD